MQITHAEARHFIQLKADNILGSVERTILSAHLQTCSECRRYAEDLAEVQNILVPVMKRQWERKPAPLPINTLIAEEKSKVPTRIILTMRSVVISVVFLAFILTAWQFTLSSGWESGPAPFKGLAVPTPSIQSTRTKAALQNCEMTHYRVQPGDTLESIAGHFNITKEDLLALNRLETSTLHVAMELTIPICSSTPTSIADPTGLIRTYTPVTSPAFSTPGGS